DGRVGPEGGGVVGGGDVQGPLRPPHPPLGISDHRQHIEAAGDPQRGAQLADSGAIVAAAVGEDPVGLAHRADARTDAGGELGVSLGGLRIAVLEHVGRHDVLGYTLRGLTAQPAELVEEVAVQLLAGDTGGQLRFEGARFTFGACRPPGPAGARAARRAAAPVLAAPALAALAAGPPPVSASSAPPGLGASWRVSPSRTFGPPVGLGVAVLAPAGMVTDRARTIPTRRAGT